MNYSRLMNELADPIVFLHFHKMADIRHRIFARMADFSYTIFSFFYYNKYKKAGICVDTSKCFAEKQSHENLFKKLKKWRRSHYAKRNKKESRAQNQNHIFDAVRRIIQYLGNYNVKDNGEGSHDQ